MSESVGTLTPTDWRRRCEDRLAGPMFGVAVVFLIILAGLLHRYPRLSAAENSPSLFSAVDVELFVISWGVVPVWLVVVAEQVFRLLVLRGDASVSQRVGSWLVISIVPPLRMGLRGRYRPGHLWLPGLGWQPVDKELRGRLEKFFSVPMIVIALCVLPLLAIEFWWADQVRAYFGLALFLDIGISIIWLGFALEFIVMVSVAESKWRYCLLHWIDLAVVLLPLVEFLPIARLLRLGQLLRAEQLTRMSRLYRLQGLAMRAWRALLVLEVIQLLLGNTLEKRLRQLEQLLAAKEEEATQLRKEIADLKERIAQKNQVATEAVEPATGPSHPCSDPVAAALSSATVPDTAPPAEVTSEGVQT
jgi:voltage-gated potassium channel